MTAALPEDPGGGSRVEMYGESRESSTFTQIGTQVIQPPLPEQAFRPWAELTPPAGLSNLPRPGLFVGRAGELARLDAAMAGRGGAVVQAVHGLGGVGKSTLAARWATAHAAEYDLTWWITAATPANIDAGLARLAVALQPALTGVLPLEALREGAVQWLAAHPGWLVILDNVTDPADVAPLLARTSAGRYLVTSRRASGWHGTGVAPVRLDVLDPAEAQALLAAILASGRPREADSTAELCEELGFLPLAIEQAGAYLAQAGASPREYQDLLARYPAAMYQAAVEGGDARTIARIWRVTLDRLAEDPLAGQVLRILAWYAPDAIPRTLLDGLADPPAVLRAVGRLATYSMLTADAGTLAMHRLVQAVTRTPDLADPHRDPQQIDAARDQATRQLAAAVPAGWQDPAGWPAWQILLPHIDALASHAPPDTDTDITAYLLNEAGAFLHSQRQVARAAGYLQRALADRQRLLGENHPDTLTCRDNLAGTYRAAGDLSRAIPLAEQALADRQQVLGQDHPQTLTSRNNLAYAYRAAGDLSRAISLFEQAMADRQRILGDDHPDTLTSRDNLAGAYRAAGDLSRAISLFEQALADRQRILGDDHPDTLTSRSDLAGGYKAAGDLARAIPLFEQALADRQRILGDDHPQTLASRGNLAGAYQAAGDLERAVPLYEQTLADRQRILGDDHPHTLASRGNLAGAYQAAGDLGRAIPLFEQALADSVRVLGTDHPQTKIVRGNLAAARQDPQ